MGKGLHPLLSLLSNNLQLLSLFGQLFPSPAGGGGKIVCINSIQAAAVTAAPPQGGRTLTEVSGDVSGAAVANGSERRQRTRAAEEAVGGGIFVK